MESLPSVGNSSMHTGCSGAGTASQGIHQTTLRTGTPGTLSADEGSPAHHMDALVRRPARALETRAAFLNGRPPYLLYFWEVADCHQLLQSSLQRLSDSVCPTDGGLTSLSGESNPRQHRAPAGVKQAPSVLDAASLIPLAQSMNKVTDYQQNAFLQRERG